jgi:acyl-CoA thioester hydrolase
VIRDVETGKVINKAHTIQVALNIATREMEWVCPSVLWQKLGVTAT